VRDNLLDLRRGTVVGSVAIMPSSLAYTATIGGKWRASARRQSESVQIIKGNVNRVEGTKPSRNSRTI
jgi:hypothetical protein